MLMLFLFFSLLPIDYEASIYLHGCRWDGKVVDLFLNGLKVLDQETIKCDRMLGMTYSRFHCRWNPEKREITITSFFGGEKYRLKSDEPKVLVALMVDGRPYWKTFYFKDGPTIVTEYRSEPHFEQLTWPMIFE